ncbi:MAG: ATP-binding protein [Burkholderiales bacterium]
MFRRTATDQIRKALAWSPAVAILGPRQVGKTTLCREIAAEHAGAIYLDLDRPGERARLSDPVTYLSANRQHLVILDEVQNVPEIFSVLRGEIDDDRRPGRFLILGSASFRLLRQTQSLAGRLALVDMTPLQLVEVIKNFTDVQSLWLRGGFPLSYMAGSDDQSWSWREGFVRHFLGTDLPSLGIHVDPDSIGRFWRMLAHSQSQLFNASSIAASLGVSAPTVSRWLDHLEATLMVRQLPPYFTNLGKRLVKSPKVYVRDSGLLHYLLNIREVNDLLGHPATGASWEGFVVEQIYSRLAFNEMASFYRTAAGAELDLIVESGGKKLGFEIKFSSAPKVTKGFWQACEDVGVNAAYIVAPVRDGWPLAANVRVASLMEAIAALSGLK